MWRVAIASVVAVGCVDPVEYQVTTSLSRGSTARLVFDGLLYLDHTELYEVSDYDELRDVAVSVTVRANNVDYFVVLPFAASACGSEEWMHSGELTRIEVDYNVYGFGTNWNASTDRLRCVDSNGEDRYQ
jgi:hypothetical protein